MTLCFYTSCNPLAKKGERFSIDREIRNYTPKDINSFIRANTILNIRGDRTILYICNFFHDTWTGSFIQVEHCRDIQIEVLRKLHGDIITGKKEVYGYLPYYKPITPENILKHIQALEDLNLEKLEE
jgi:hypothetical protein